MTGAPHAPSLYAAAAGPLPAFPQLTEPVRGAICVIGGGYTGLSAALHLAEAKREVVLLEAEQVGWGASGRNGGQLHSGQRRDQDWLERRFGRAAAHELWRMAEEAKALVHELLRKHGIAADWRPGLIEAAHRARDVPHERAYVEKLRTGYGYDRVSWLEADEFRAMTGARGYFGGRLDLGGGHLDPLKFAFGLAAAAERAGARIFEGARAVAIDGFASSGFRIATAAGPTVAADIVILAGDGYLDRIDREAEARIMPIANYILATEPIGAGRPGGILPGGEAVSDTRFVVYYWRPSPDGRLVFGGGETYTSRPPADIPAFVRRHLLRVYPQLRETRIDFGWGGRLGITLHRLPLVRRLRPGVYTAAGYSGQGVALAPYAGKLLADAIAGDAGRFDRLAALPAPRFPGGRLLRWPSLVAGMSWYALRDRL